MGLDDRQGWPVEGVQRHAWQGGRDRAVSEPRKGRLSPDRKDGTRLGQQLLGMSRMANGWHKEAEGMHKDLGLGRSDWGH